MNILALDTGIHTGWATSSASGMENWSLGTDKQGIRFRNFRLWLEIRISYLTIDTLIFEAPHYRGRAATESCVAFTSRVIECGHTAHIPVYSIHTATLKLLATGNGRASKEEMLAKALEITGRNVGEIVDDNEADAICMAWVFLNKGEDFFKER